MGWNCLLTLYAGIVSNFIPFTIFVSFGFTNIVFSSLRPSSNILELKYLDFLGVSPIVTGCAVCGKTTNIVSLSPTAGGFICKDCYQNEGYYSDKAIKLLQMYYYVDLEKITKIDVNPKVNAEINKFLEDYYNRYTGIYLNSKKMLKNVIKLK